MRGYLQKYNRDISYGALQGFLSTCVVAGAAVTGWLAVDGAWWRATLCGALTVALFGFGVKARIDWDRERGS